MIYDSVHDPVMVLDAISPGPALVVVCNCDRSALAYIVPPAVVDEVPVANGDEDVLKLAETPLVDRAPSPVAVADAVAAVVTTEPTIEMPVAGALLSIL